MRVAAIADIHGNLPALEAVLADVRHAGADLLVVAGDTISGPWPVECFDLVERAGALVVRGNADREVCERRTRFGPLATWSADRLGEERLAVAATWPLARVLEGVDGLGRVLVCHATPRSDEPIYTCATPDGEVLDLLGDVGAEVAVVGHTHVQFDRMLSSGLRVVNPGSVGPYEGRRGAFWALLGPGVELQHTGYDVEGAVAAIRELGAPVKEEQLGLLLEPLQPDAAIAEFERLRGA
ncbi:MAG TPA: metallophosphoesterase family protein [Gaiellaceae bacterium]|nr:metallophosphoesterase family protein [Gaiellaceae bacterium]